MVLKGEVKPGAARFGGFDRLRVFSLCVIVIWHGLRPFCNLESDSYELGRHSQAAEFLAWALRGFALRDFFVVSGFFAHLTYQRYGTTTYLRHRFVRLVIPLTVAVVLWNLMAFSKYAAKNGMTLSELLSVRWEHTTWYEFFTLHHFWFLVYLAIFTFGVAMVPVAGTESFRSRAGPLVRRWFRKVMIHPLCSLGLAVPTAMALALHHSHHPSPTPGTTRTVLELPPSGTLLLYFVLFFGFGWILFLEQNLLEKLVFRWRAHLAVAVVLRGVLYQLVFHSESTPATLTLIFYLEALYSWTAVLGLLGFFHRLSEDRYLWRYLADAAYWSYLFHLLPLGYFLRMFLGNGLPLWLVYLLAEAATGIVTLLTYHLFVRYTIIGTILNGPRTRKST